MYFNTISAYYKGLSGGILIFFLNSAGYLCNFAPFLPKVSRREALMGIINQLLTNIMNNNYD